jgi:hypothetical protein
MPDTSLSVSFLQKKVFACNFFVPAILSKADIKAQQALI